MPDEVSRSLFLEPRVHRRNRKAWVRVAKWLAILSGIFMVFVAMGGVCVLFYLGQFKEKAALFDLNDVYKLEKASLIYDRNGEEIGRIYVQNRQPITYAEIPQHLVDALTSAEDSRFFEHRGVDYQGIARAVVLNLQAGEVTQGASTITQQLARNAFELRERTLERKLVEAFLAARLEERFKKEEILELYFNRIYFGSGFYGIEAAAEGYFGKTTSELTVADSATLCGLIKSPNRLSPFNNPEGSLKTRNFIFRRMYEESKIGYDQVLKLSGEPLHTVPKQNRANRSNYVYEQVRQKVIDLLGYERAYEGGFRIYTTIDNHLQKLAENSIKTHLAVVEESVTGYKHQTIKEYKTLKEEWSKTSQPADKSPPAPEYLQGALLLIDNRSGAILASVGGRDFSDSMFDRTTMARRPPGTAFLPFVYAAAFQQGDFPGTEVDDSPIDNRRVMIGGMSGILGEWGVETLAKDFHEGSISARRALTQSKIAATVRLGISAGLSNVVGLAQNAGIHFLSDIKNYNATLLGRSEATLSEMCLAYTVFPNGGSRPRETFIISRIEDGQGKSIPEGEHLDFKEESIVDTVTAYQITSCLEDALKEGTGRKAYTEYGLKDFPVAGKTGTEYAYTDNWFVGFTDRVTCAVWAGFDTPKTIYKGAFSNTTVLPIWVDAMNAAAEIYPPEAFAPPEGAQKVKLCKISGGLATDACFENVSDGPGMPTERRATAYVEYVRPDTPITRICTIHSGEPLPGAIGPAPVENLLSMNMTSSPLRARVANSAPVLPVGPTILGDDPYNAVTPVIRARVVNIASPKPKGPSPDESFASSGDEEESGQQAGSVDGDGDETSPEASTSDDSESQSAEGFPALEMPSARESRVKLPAPAAITFE